MKTIKKLALMLLLLILSVSGSAQSKNGQTYQDPEGTGDWYLMLEDFNGTTPTIGGWRFDNKQSCGEATLTETGKYKYSFKGYTNSEYFYVDVTLPQGKTMDNTNFTSIKFSLLQKNGDIRNKTVNVCAGDVGSTSSFGDNIGTFTTLNNDGTQTVEVAIPAGISKTGSFRLWIGGGITTNGCYVEVDDIRLKYNGTPTPTGPFTKNLSTNPYKAKLDDVLNLEVSATDATAYQWYKGGNATDYNGTQIDGATGTTYNVPTDVEGTYYYYCDATVNDEVAHSNIATVVVSASNSKNGKSYQEDDDWFLMLQDFEDNEIGDSYTVVNANGGEAKVQADPKEVSEKSLNFITGSYKDQEYIKIDITLPTGVVLDDTFTDLYFDIVYNTSGDNTHKQIKIKINSNDLGSISTDGSPKTDWETKNYSLSGKTTSENSFSFCIGWESANYANYFIDNIRLKYKEAPTPVDPTSGDCGDDAHWAYDATTTSLAITGTGEMTDFAEGATPWNAYLSAITAVDVAEGITKVGTNAFKGINSSAVLTFHSIPAFGANAVVEGEANLTLVDANHPFVASDFTNAPTFAEASYVRSLSKDVLATFVLPFVPADITASPIKFYAIRNTTASSVSFALQESIEAGVPYLIENTGDEGEFILVANDVTLTDLVPQTQYSMNLVGVYQYTQVRDDNAYALNNNNKFQRTSKNINLQPFRAYLYAPNSVNAKIDVDFGEPTGINDVKGSRLDDHNALYNLQGVRVKAGYKGVVLTNGKKFIAQ